MSFIHCKTSENIFQFVKTVCKEIPKFPADSLQGF